MDQPLRELVHDLSNELAVIASSAELARTELEPGSDADVHLERIHEAARAAGALVRQIRGNPVTESRAGTGGAAGHVLVVDDSEPIRQLICHTLQSSGFEVDVAAGAEDALGKIAGPRAPDVLLTDLRMPSVSGVDLAERARRIRPRIPVVFVTGDAVGAIELSGGAAPVVRKPFDASELIEAVQTALSH